MNQENQAEYIQVSSFPKDELGEQMSTSDLHNRTKTKPFKPIEQAYLKAFIKIMRQRTKADPPKGVHPRDSHQILDTTYPNHHLAS